MRSLFLNSSYQKTIMILKLKDSGLISILFFTIFLSCSKDKDPEESLIPEVETDEVYFESPTTLLTGGRIISEGSSEVTNCGICWSMHENPTLEDDFTIDTISYYKGSAYFGSIVFNLEPNTKYYYRAYVKNKVGIGYGEILTYITKNYGLIADNEGNQYKTITIGKQTWMAENLRAIKYKNGDPIQYFTSFKSLDDTDAEYCAYDNSVVNSSTYGMLYNWYAVNDIRGIAPEGWHVATNSDWQELEDYLGYDYAGDYLKEYGPEHWNTLNEGNNIVGFSALPGGVSDYSYHGFSMINYGGFWWTESESNNYSAWYRWIYSNISIVFKNTTDKRCFCSVRCVKN